MSTKLYGGRRIVLDSDFDLLQWQDKLDRLREEITAIADQKLLDTYFARAIYQLDRLTIGLPAEDPEASPQTLAWRSIDDDCREIDKGIRRPLLDSEVSVCWRLVPDRRTLLVILFAEMQDLRDRDEEALGLEDYHYQNQVDPPDGCTWEEMQERGKVWEAALGNWNNPPVARFHTFEVCPAPKHPPLIGWMDPKPEITNHLTVAQRAQAVAFDYLFNEVKGDREGRDLMDHLRWAYREAREGGSLHDRLLEIRGEVLFLLVPEPTWADLGRKPRPAG